MKRSVKWRSCYAAMTALTDLRPSKSRKKNELYRNDHKISGSSGIGSQRMAGQALTLIRRPPTTASPGNALQCVGGRQADKASAGAYIRRGNGSEDRRTDARCLRNRNDSHLLAHT